jgi:hypothetical protein
MKHIRLKYSKPSKKFEFWINSNVLKKDIEFIIENKITSIVLCDVANFKIDNLNFLKDIPFVKDITITSDLIKDFNGLLYLNELNDLYISNVPKNVVLDFAKNLKLKRLNVPTSKITNISNLESLTLGGCNVLNFDFSRIKKLKELRLIQCKGITNLTFLPEFLPLQSLEFSYMPKLISIEGISKFNKSLKEIELTNCKNLNDLDKIGSLINLEKVLIENSGTIKSAMIFKKFNNLKYFVIMGKSKFLDSNWEILKEKKINHLYVGK